jgi:hypothetical protein
MSERLRISGKNLGQLALKNFCPRCFWIRLKCGDKIPFAIFPGIFSSLDAFQKKVTNCHYEKHGRIPKWLDGFGKIGQPMKVPHHSVFRIIDPDTDVLLTGVPDEILKRRNGTLTILDYKTARFTANQDELLPLYKVQLNAYAFIAQRIGMGKVTALGLIYYEPQTDLTTDGIDAVLEDDGFEMKFRAKLLPIELNQASIPLLLHKVRQIYDRKTAPKGRNGCKDCKLMDGLVEVATK